MDLLNETVLLKTKYLLFNLLIREISQFQCCERLLYLTYVAFKKAFFREMQFWSHCYTVVSYQAIFTLSVYKIPAVYLSDAKELCFCTICDFGSPTMRYCFLRYLAVNLLMFSQYKSTLNNYVTHGVRQILSQGA